MISIPVSRQVEAKPIVQNQISCKHVYIAAKRTCTYICICPIQHCMHSNLTEEIQKLLKYTQDTYACIW